MDFADAITVTGQSRYSQRRWVLPPCNQMSSFYSLTIIYFHKQGRAHAHFTADPFPSYR